MFEAYGGVYIYLHIVKKVILSIVLLYIKKYNNT